jgi:hypothetical protein
MVAVGWVLRHKLLTVIISLAGSVLLWLILAAYINPQDATDRKDVIQVFALIVAGIVTAISGIVGKANLKQQRDLAEQRAQEDALQAYFEQMGALLTNYNLNNTDRKDIRQLSRAQTFTVLPRLNGSRKGSLIRFLYGAELISGKEPICTFWVPTLTVLTLAAPTL